MNQQLVYPCGKAEMDIIKCPECLDHFRECIEKSKKQLGENVAAYMAVKFEIAKYAAEKKQRIKSRARAHSLAERILKRKAEIEALQKELSTIFYYDGQGRAFNHSDRTCWEKAENIRAALRLRLEH